jgi:hypothetical protein
MQAGCDDAHACHHGRLVRARTAYATGTANRRCRDVHIARFTQHEQFAATIRAVHSTSYSRELECMCSGCMWRLTTVAVARAWSINEWNLEVWIATQFHSSGSGCGQIRAMYTIRKERGFCIATRTLPAAHTRFRRRNKYGTIVSRKYTHENAKKHTQTRANTFIWASAACPARRQCVSRQPQPASAPLCNLSATKTAPSCGHLPWSCDLSAERQETRLHMPHSAKYACSPCVQQRDGRHNRAQSLPSAREHACCRH